MGSWRVCTDSDWAGDLKERTSTSGGILLLGDHCIKTWTHTQIPLALSSCEADVYAMVEGASQVGVGDFGAAFEGSTRALGAQAVAKELGVVVDDIVVEVATDSSAAKSFASRRGLGRNRHVEVKWLWLQQAVADGKVRLKKIHGTLNPADILTKYKSLGECRALLADVNIEVVAKAQDRGAIRDGGAAHSEAAEKIGWNCLGKGVSWADAYEEEEEEEGE